MECAVITNNSMPKNVDGLVSDSYNRRRGIPLQSETLRAPNLDLLNFLITYLNSKHVGLLQYNTFEVHIQHP